MKEKIMKRERAIWIGVSTLLLIVLVSVLIPTDVIAQGNDEQVDEALVIIERVFRFLQENYVDEIDTNVLLEGALDGLLKSLDDPFSVYLDAEAIQDLDDTTRGRFGGVGIYISKQRTNEDVPLSYIEVIAPIEDTPAYAAGIEAGDLITQIEGESTLELTIDDAVKQLRGAPNSLVNLTIRRGERTTFPVTLVRDFIEVPTIKMDMLPNKIGYLRIITFTPFTHDRVREAIDFFEEQRYESLIVDLRSNPGGLLNGVVNTVDLFFNNELIVGTRGRMAGENEEFHARIGKMVDDSIEIVVLVDRGTASASEIMAGALQDHERATIIGETTYGKGSVQQIRRIGDGGLRLTVSRYYTPNGEYIDKIGIEPDVEHELPELSDEEREAYIDLQNSSQIRGFVDDNRDTSENAIARFANQLHNDGVILDTRYIRRLLRLELNRANGVSPAYDLDFDLTLQHAIDYLQDNTNVRSR